MSGRVQGETCSGFTVIRPGLPVASGEGKGPAVVDPTHPCAWPWPSRRGGPATGFDLPPAPCTQGEHNLGGQQSECIFLPI